MRIGFDARYLSRGLVGGVRTYVFHLARTLPGLAPDDEFVYYIDAKAPFELGRCPSNVSVRTLPWISPLSTLANDVRIARWMARDLVDVAHFPGNYGPRGAYALVVTVHDALNLFRMSEHRRGFGRKPRQVAMMAYLGWQTRRALADADSVLTTSEHARGEIARLGGRRPDRIVAIHEAAGEEFTPVTDPAALESGRARFQRRPLMVLADGIKNPEALIEAYGLLPDAIRARTEIVFFSRETGPRPPVAAAMADPAVRFLARPSTADLALLMNLAAVFVFPSWYEGFGIPLVEAMSCGAPVVASTRGAIPEVVAGAGLLFDVERPAELARHLERVLESEAVRSDLRARSLARAKAFSWHTTARKTLEAYRAAVEARLSAGRP
ncbi:MAG TPA: glycosyltransferase family 1 protein [Vicinamibacterales bacterium]|nr:glycosyltransferase family 1 protein [Vicinamibacterales bacterium]HPW20719.1 glycosyltransferase family 1 protein [Vicinamibacterales bacterium]